MKKILVAEAMAEQFFGNSLIWSSIQSYGRLLLFKNQADAEKYKEMIGNSKNKEYFSDIEIELKAGDISESVFRYVKIYKKDN